MSEPSMPRYLEEIRQHFNEPMLAGREKLYRCIGYGESAIDCYIIAEGMHGKRLWQTMVGGYFWLRRLRWQGRVKAHNGEIWDDYRRLDDTLELNGAPKREEFIIDIRPDDWEGGKPLEERLREMLAAPTPQEGE